MDRFLLFIGNMVFPIYLMNTAAIGVAKAMLLLLVPWDGISFLIVYVPIITLVGICCPIVLKIVVFSRIGWLDRLTS